MVSCYGGQPSRLPAVNVIKEMREPIVLASVLVPQEYLGNVINLCVEKRGVQKDMQFIGKQVSLSYELPMNEVVMDFRTVSNPLAGYASLDYQFDRNERSSLVMDVLINGRGLTP